MDSIKNKKIFIKTYGCQANINDSEILAAEYVKDRYKIVNSEKDADIILINSCSVKNKTQSKIINYIGKYYNDINKNILITGCLIKTINLKKQFPRIKIINSLNLKRIKQSLIRKDKNVAIIQISQGCISNCSFCATKTARGKLKSFSINDIKYEFERAVSEGCSKIYLTSQDNGCYGFDINIDIVKLLNELIKIDGKYKIRIGMMNPQHITSFIDKLIEVYKSPKIIKFIHIPVQSGSDRILKEMKRGHKVNDFVNIVKKFRKNFPRSKFSDSTIATDIIIGYPGETEDDFNKTLELIKKIKPEVLNISAFSSRPKTPASNLKQLPSEIIKNRTRKINELYLSYRKDLSSCQNRLIRTKC